MPTPRLSFGPTRRIFLPFRNLPSGLSVFGTTEETTAVSNSHAPIASRRVLALRSRVGIFFMEESLVRLARASFVKELLTSTRRKCRLSFFLEEGVFKEGEGRRGNSGLSSKENR